MIATTELDLHQIQAVNYMFHNEHRNDSLINNNGRVVRGGILADDVGMGKTSSILGLMHLSSKLNLEETNLIIAPLTVKINWSIESYKFFLHSNICNFENLQSTPLNFSTHKIVICTWDVFQKTESLKNFPFSRVVLDEAHFLFAPNLFNAIIDFPKHEGQFRWCLTATPIMNHLRDLQPLLAFIDLPLTDDIILQHHKMIIEKYVLRRQLVYETVTTTINFELSAFEAACETHIYSQHYTIAQRNLYTNAVYYSTNIFASLHQPKFFPSLTDIENNTPGSRIKKIIMILNSIPSEDKVLIYSKNIKFLNYLKKYFAKINYKFLIITGEPTAVPLGRWLGLGLVLRGLRTQRSQFGRQDVGRGPQDEAGA